MSKEHAHGTDAKARNEKRVALAALLTGAFMVAEFFGGIISGSLALIADAGHMLTDFASLLLAWGAIRLSRRPANWRRSYGYDRFSVLAAFVNGLALFVIAAWVCVEAVQRFMQPVEILGGLMFWVAFAGLVVNIVAFWILSRGGGANLNVRAAAIHVMGDLLGSIAALGASVVILTTGWQPIDPILSIFVALIILRSAFKVVQESGSILLESAPEHLQPSLIQEELLREIEEVTGVSHIHAWSISDERPMLTLEVEVRAGTNVATVRRCIKDRLRDRFGVDHATVEMHERPREP